MLLNKSVSKLIIMRSIEAPVTSHHIQRFLVAIVRRVTSKSNDVPSYGWMTQGFTSLMNGLHFYRKDMTPFDRHERERLAHTIQCLLNEGKITTSLSRKPEWVGVHILRHIVTTVMMNALRNGTINWDVTLSKMTSLLLLSSTCARVGDLYYHHLDKQPFPYLIYKDIVLKFVGGSDLEHLMANITIRNEKGKKYVQSLPPSSHLPFFLPLSLFLTAANDRLGIILV